MPPDQRPGLDVEDWSLIAITLAHWAGNPNELEIPSERRAYELIERIAAAHGCSPPTLVTEYRPPDIDSRPSDLRD